MEKALKEKLEAVVALVNNVMADPDIDIEYCIPEVATTADSCDIPSGSKHLGDVSGNPYILVKYVISENNVHTRKIRLGKTYLPYAPEKIADLVTFSIEQFKTEIDSVEMG